MNNDFNWIYSSNYLLLQDIHAIKNKQLLEKVDIGIQKAKSDALELLKSGKNKAVLTMNIGSDSKAIKRATEELKRVAPGLAFICLTADEEKITAFSYVPDNLIASLKANEWVSKSLEACNGRFIDKLVNLYRSKLDHMRIVQGRRKT
jgi:alanyl-tRNA synthetase